MKDTTMQELGMENEVNLCDSCHEVQPECNPNFVIYGTGKGTDNIAACDIYNPCHTRNYEEERDIISAMKKPHSVDIVVNGNVLDLDLFEKLIKPKNADD